ncbi:MAG: type I glutamate--ammonia ligase [Hyphomonadaceae bacterium]|nr:type I glutamate--ammonia ligase [Hyphomonadaceae bacterium]
MSRFADIMKLIADEDVEYVDFRFTDIRGKMQHVTFDIGMIDEETLEEGIMFDGSSIAGWKAINESDMVMMPDPENAKIDPFFERTTLAIFCDILEPGTLKPYNRCPRGIGKKAEAYVKSAGIGDTVYFGPEAEFFLFDDVRFSTSANSTGYAFDSTELPMNSDKVYAEGNSGMRPGPKGGYFPVPPIDSAQDIRTEMLSIMKDLGLAPEKHHHEVAPAQHELGLKFQTLTVMGDFMNLYKYVIQNVAAAYGKSATFMPKPYYKDNGSGMHVHQSIWKGGKPLFAGDKYADLSQECLYYIGGIIKHAKAINAFANSTTNSYKRLVPGYEAPVLLAYSARNRSASIRIPYSTSPKAKRLEARFPDPAGNMYLTMTALLMAGLDGIINKIDPGPSFDKDLYSLPPEELAGVPTVAASLDEALAALDADRDFLKAGGVMDDDFIDAYIELKKEETDRLNTHPHPVEFDMYYKC